MYGVPTYSPLDLTIRGPQRVFFKLFSKKVDLLLDCMRIMGNVYSPSDLAARGPRRGYFWGEITMGQNQFFREPTKKRAVAFFDGQNLYHQAKATFGHKIPNYDQKNCLPPFAMKKDGCLKVFVFILECQNSKNSQNGTNSGAVNF